MYYSSRMAAATLPVKPRMLFPRVGPFLYVSDESIAAVAAGLASVSSASHINWSALFIQHQAALKRLSQARIVQWIMSSAEIRAAGGFESIPQLGPAHNVMPAVSQL